MGKSRVGGRIYHFIYRLYVSQEDVYATVSAHISFFLFRLYIFLRAHIISVLYTHRTNRQCSIKVRKIVGHSKKKILVCDPVSNNHSLDYQATSKPENYWTDHLSAPGCVRVGYGASQPFDQGAVKVLWCTANESINGALGWGFEF